MTGKRKLRAYADTSVFGGVFDEEFAEASKAFFDQVVARRLILVLSTVTLRELDGAPAQVQGVLAGLPAEQLEMLPDDEDVIRLRDAYLEAGVVGPSCEGDAEHVAAASVAEVDLIVSWNFRHIVHFDKIRAYNGVNLLYGYRQISIHSPREVVEP